MSEQKKREQVDAILLSSVNACLAKHEQPQHKNILDADKTALLWGARHALMNTCTAPAPAADDEREMREAFERWQFTARNAKSDMPWLTHLLYQVCDNDEKKFELACDIVEIAWQAAWKEKSK